MFFYVGNSHLKISDFILKLNVRFLYLLKSSGGLLQINKKIVNLKCIFQKYVDFLLWYRVKQNMFDLLSSKSDTLCF